MADPRRRHIVEALGSRLLDGVEYAGGMTVLMGKVARATARGIVSPKVRLGREAVSRQMASARGEPSPMMAPFSASRAIHPLTDGG